MACVRNTVFEGNNDVIEKLQDHYRVLFRVYDCLCSGRLFRGESRTLSEFLLAFFLLTGVVIGPTVLKLYDELIKLREEVTSLKEQIESLKSGGSDS